MIVYCDTSALVKRYVREAGSESVLDLWEQASWIVTSTVAYTEALSVFFRKCQELPQERRKGMRPVYEWFKTDWNALIRVDVTAALHDTIDRVLEQHALRGFDAIHLASALVVREKVPSRFVFACFDHKLIQAAKMFGFETSPGEYKRAEHRESIWEPYR